MMPLPWNQGGATCTEASRAGSLGGRPPARPPARPPPVRLTRRLPVNAPAAVLLQASCCPLRTTRTPSCATAKVVMARAELAPMARMLRDTRLQSPGSSGMAARVAAVGGRRRECGRRQPRSELSRQGCLLSRQGCLCMPCGCARPAACAHLPVSTPRRPPTTMPPTAAVRMGRDARVWWVRPPCPLGRRAPACAPGLAEQHVAPCTAPAAHPQRRF
jgi:hypothetical protein